MSSFFGSSFSVWWNILRSTLSESPSPVVLCTSASQKRWPKCVLCAVYEARDSKVLPVEACVAVRMQMISTCSAAKLGDALGRVVALEAVGARVVAAASRLALGL